MTGFHSERQFGEAVDEPVTEGEKRQFFAVPGDLRVERAADRAVPLPHAGHQAGRQRHDLAAFVVFLERPAEVRQAPGREALQVGPACQRALVQQFGRQVMAKAGPVEDEVGQRALLLPGLPHPPFQRCLVPLELLVEARRVCQHETFDVPLDLAKDRVQRSDRFLEQPDAPLQHLEDAFLDRALAEQVVDPARAASGRSGRVARSAARPASDSTAGRS